jgi:hypothetical protein
LLSTKPKPAPLAKPASVRSAIESFRQAAVKKTRTMTGSAFASSSTGGPVHQAAGMMGAPIAFAVTVNCR